MLFEKPSSDGTNLRKSFAQFATGVTVVSCLDAIGEPVGFTANSFSSVSLNPALLLVSIAHHNALHSVFCNADYFAINILAASQQDISQNFAKPSGGRFHPRINQQGEAETMAIKDWQGPYDLPMIEGALAWFCCKQFKVVPAGDHDLLIGEIMAHGHLPNAESSLLYWNSQYHHLSP